MDDKIRKRAAFYTVTSIVDANNGNVPFESDKLKRIFNNEDNVVMVEYTNGEIGLAADANIDTLESAICEWRDKHPNEFERIMKNKPM